jgi:Flp pilus assembly pilin Flp
MLAILTHLEVKVREFVGRVSRADEGAGIVEYLLLVLFIALVMVLALAFFTGQLGEGFSRAGNSIPS